MPRPRATSPRRPHGPAGRGRRPGADQEVAPEPGASLVGIDNPDDADLYPPTETPDRGERRRGRPLPRREG